MAIVITIVIMVFIGKAIQRTVNKNRFATRYVALSDVDYMDGHDFEYYCADLLRYDGFSKITVTKGSNDQGVDIIAYKNGVKYAIQCKRYNNALGNKPVQEVNTGRVIYGCSQAIVLTNSYFTKGAIEAARATGVLLWDRTKLDALIHSKQRGGTTKTHLSFTSGVTAGSNKVLKIVGVVFILTIITIIAITINNTEDSESNKKDTAPPQIEAQSTEVKLENGESAIYSDSSIIIAGMMFARHNGNLKYLDMVDGERINCCVYANVENTGEKPIDLTGYDVVLVCDGIEYEQMLVEDPEFLFFYQSIAPKESLKGKVIDFQIPRSQQNSNSEICITIISPDGQNATWQLR